MMFGRLSLFDTLGLLGYNPVINGELSAISIPSHEVESGHIVPCLLNFKWVIVQTERNGNMSTRKEKNVKTVGIA
jgi:hypothetical protein